MLTKSVFALAHQSLPPNSCIKYVHLDVHTSMSLILIFLFFLVNDLFVGCSVIIFPVSYYRVST